MCDITMKPSTSKVVTVNKDDGKIQDMCIAEGCKNSAVQHSEWDNEYCSVNCCYNHCKATFKIWLEGNKATKASTTTVSSQENVDSPSDQQQNS